MSTKEIIAKQQGIKEQKAMVKAIRDSLAAEESSLSEGHRAAARLADLGRDLSLAEADMIIEPEGGHDKRRDEITADIVKTKATVEKHEKTVAGLNIRLREAENRLANMADEHRALVVAHIRHTCEAIAGDYMKAAEDMKNNFLRLAGFAAINNMLASQNGDGRIGSGHELFSLSVPVFDLAACGQHRNHSSEWPKWQAIEDLKKQFGNHNTPLMPALINAARCGLEADGVEIPTP